MHTFQILLLILSSLWIASEIGLAVFRRSASGARRKDAGTLKLLNFVIYAAVTVAWVLAVSGYGHIRLSHSVLWSALALIAVGMVLRWWAVLTLRQFFTVDVAIQPNHQLVQRGPYRWLRHPAYSGVLLSFLGLALCTSSWVAGLVIVIPISAVFLYRVRVEEQALTEAFPQEYPSYAAQRAGLIPWIY